MQKKAPVQKLSATVSPTRDGDALSRIVAIAPAPVLPGENEFQYAKMAERIVQEAQPADAIEEFLVRDVIDLTWEVLRARRLKVGSYGLRSAAGFGWFWMQSGMVHLRPLADLLHRESAGH
jgi:hypothetical protein